MAVYDEDFKLKTIEKFEKYKILSPSGCWLWNYSIDPISNYGRISINGIRYNTHRLSCFIYWGLDLDNSEQFACHKPICSNRNCFNPAHLYVGTNKTNQLDVWQDKCKRGHPLVGDNVGIGSYTNRRYCRACVNIKQKENRQKLRRIS